jgi:hypothetical protein
MAGAVCESLKRFELFKLSIAELYLNRSNDLNDSKSKTAEMNLNRSNCLNDELPGGKEIRKTLS